MKNTSFVFALMLGAAMPLAYAADAPATTPAPISDTIQPVEKAASAMEAENATAYANAAAIGDMYEIKAANIAWERSSSQEVKDFAKMLIAAHTGTTAKLTTLVDQAEGTLPGSLDDRHQALIDALDKADDATFNNVFLTQQIAEHETALKLHTAFAESGDRQEFKDFAKETAKAVEMHLEQAKALAKSMTAASN